MRYFIQLAYHGKKYCGWQRQPQSLSVQQALEEALSILCKTQIEMTGCGRTDSGVHASFYIAHIDTDFVFDQTIHLRSLNAILPSDISIQRIWQVNQEQHARFSAYSRSYIYYISSVKDPFRLETSWQNSHAAQFSLETLNKCAALIKSQSEFKPFCKTHSDVEHYRCTIYHAEWLNWEDRGLQFHVSANRFLRGMVRLMVGACVEVAKGNIALEALEQSLSNQTELPRPLSAPAHGLFLTDVKYPTI
jgi:tRNA pseudouridine38-40 synthase